jgi:hypothetical protein
MRFVPAGRGGDDVAAMQVALYGVVSCSSAEVIEVEDLRLA